MLRCRWHPFDASDMDLHFPVRTDLVLEITPERILHNESMQVKYELP
ncbi:MAG: hypothetical protein R6V01_00720 [Thermoplasmatota archaeon]